jgi:cytoskeletal protein RodZ
MNLEGKYMGYDKKYIAIAVAVLAALVIFYAGTRYEKMRIVAGQKKSDSATSSTKKTKAPKSTPAATDVAPADATTSTTTTPAPATTTAPKATTTPTTKY